MDPEPTDEFRVPGNGPGIDRRALLRVGGVGLAAGAGCLGLGGGDGDDDADTDPAGTDTTAPKAGTTDGGRTTRTTTDGGRTTTRTTTDGDDDTVRIGVLQPISGDLAYYGLQSVWGFAAGLAYKTGTDPLTDVSEGTRTVAGDGVTYELLVRDTQFRGDTARAKAAELVEESDVDLLFGLTSSGAAERVIRTTVAGTDTPIVVGPAASTSITADAGTCSDRVFRASESTAMDARAGAGYVVGETDIDSVYLLGADYSFGRSVVENYQAVLESAGVTVAGKKFVPRGYEEFDGPLRAAVDAGADAVVGGFTVQTLPAFFTAAVDYDLQVFGGFATEITNAVLGELLENLLGSPLTTEKIRESQFGPFATRYHWNQYDNEVNDAFVDTYAAAYGKVPDLFTAGTFTAASAVVQAVESSGSTDGAAVADALKGMTVTDTPKGKDGYVFQGYNNQARSEMTVTYPVPTDDRWERYWDASIMPGSPPAARVDEDETTIPADSDLMDCSL